MKEKSAINGCVTFVVVIILFVSCLFIFGCSTQKSFTQKEKELCTPVYEYYKIVAFDTNYVYLENGKKLRNKDNQTFKVGNYMMLPVQFNR